MVLPALYDNQAYLCRQLRDLQLFLDLSCFLAAHGLLSAPRCLQVIRGPLHEQPAACQSHRSTVISAAFVGLYHHHPVGSAGGYSPHSTSSQPHVSTLDEPLWQTIMRDVRRIWANLILVVFPFTNRDQQSSALRNWDLWGPMVRSVSLYKVAP